MTTLKDIILERTQGGLDILRDLFPYFDEKKTFKADEEEKTASAKAKYDNGVWKVCVYDGARAPEEGYQNAINWYMYKNNIHDFVDAMKMIAADRGIDIGGKSIISKTEIIDEKREYTGFRDNIVTRELSDEEAKVIGRFVTAAICKEYKISYIESYDYTDRNGITRRTFSSDINPHFFLELEGKIYAPKSSDSRYRYMATRKMEDSRNTLWNADSLLKKYSKQTNDDDEDIVEIKKEKTIICCGYRDAVNVASLGYNVVWMSGEGLSLPGSTIKKLMEYSEIFYCADLDKTGQQQAHAACSIYLDIYRMYLPEWLMEKKDHRGKACKDITDFIKHAGKDYQKVKDAFSILLANASPYRFWYTQKSAEGQVRTKISRTWIKRFVIANGFARYMFDDGKGYIQIQGNTLQKVEQEDIKAWVNQWAANKGFGRSILDMISGTRDLSESVLNELPLVTLDIRTAGPDYQDIYFKDCIWRITKDDIRQLRQGDSDTYVWAHKIGLRETGQIVAPVIKNDVYRPSLKRKMIEDPNDATKKIQAPDPYFRIFEKDGRNEIEIINTAPQYFRFLINTCKVHWKKEVQGWAEKNGKTGALGALQKEYAKTNYGITSEFLSDDENREQIEHLINRLYTMGYLMHRWKFRALSYMVWCMDYKADSIKDSKGRSGKSIIPQTFEHLKTFATENGRDTNLTKKNHLFADVTSLTDLIIINDVHNYLDLGFFYNYVTDNLTVNPKNVAQRTIQFAQAGKVLVTSNFGPSLMDDSTLDRMLFNLFSDWYHSEKDFGCSHRPSDDFNGQLFEDWNNSEWNEFMNFMAQCCMQYFNMPKAQAPMSQVNKRHNMREAGDSFIEWADEQLIQYVNAPMVMASKIHPEDPTNDGLVTEEPGEGTYIIRTKAKQLFEQFNAGNKINMTTFTRKLKAWSELRCIELNPAHRLPTSKRIIKTVVIGDKKKQEECVYLFNPSASDIATDNRPGAPEAQLEPIF